MKMKLLLSLAVLGTFALSAAFAQTAAPKLEMTGKVDTITAEVITVRKPNDGKWVWDIKIGPGSDTVVTGKPEVGATVTVSYVGTNAQKKEKPL
jgi:hypothetical protein